MRKLLSIVLGVAVVGGAAWSGLWYYGKGRIVQEIEAQAQALRDQGNEVTFDSIAVGGFPMGYTSRIESPELTFKQQTPSPLNDELLETLYTWTAPWVEARATVMDPETIEFIFADEQAAKITIPPLGEEFPGSVFPATLVSKDFTVTTTKGDDETLFDGKATTLDINADFGVLLPVPIAATYAIKDLTVSGRVVGQPATENSLPLAIAYTMGESTVEVSIPDMEEQPGGTIVIGSSATDGNYDFTGTHEVVEGTMADMSATLDFPMLHNAPVDVTFGPANVDYRIPNAAGPDVQDFAYNMDFATITMDDALWEKMDPLGAFTREINAVRMKMSGEAVFNVPPTDPESFKMIPGEAAPIDVRNLRIDDLTIDALGLLAVASGDGVVENGVPSGTATLALTGFPGFIDSLVKSGQIPPQQAMVAQLMVDNFGKPDATGETLTFDFELRERMIFVNGIPVGEAPFPQ